MWWYGSTDRRSAKGFEPSRSALISAAGKGTVRQLRRKHCRRALYRSS